MNAGKEQTTIRLPSEVLEKIRREAQYRNTSLNGMINMLLAKGLKNINQGLL